MSLSLADFLRFDSHANKIAFIEHSLYRRRFYHYGQILEGALRVCGAFQQTGILPGDRVILQGENTARWVMTFYGCVLSRVVAVPIDASFSADFVKKIQTIAEAKAVFCDSDPGNWQKLFHVPSIPFPKERADESDLAEIIFTSGTTGEPKGVMITHGNLLSNLVPVYNEIQKYRKYAFPFSPLGFVHLIPLSHLFGQIMGLFIPQMLVGKVIFSEPAPPRVIESVRQNKATAVICVPQELQILTNFVKKQYHPEPVGGILSHFGFPGRWLYYRKIHSDFGWKFWAFIVGGASLPVELEDFWSQLGYAVIQGYGLTETAPSVTITHPLKGIKKGSVGRKLPGLEVKIAEDGEILVRGPNVSPGYFKNEAATREVFKDGWLHTGDIGKFDENGNLILLGRKKEAIVTPEGLNVYPQDVENVLNQDPRVLDSAVVAGKSGEVHAVLILKEGVKEEEISRIISSANSRLENFQRIRTYSLWKDREFPRTTTGKLKRLAIVEGITGQAPEEGRIEKILKQLLSGEAGDQPLDLSSLERMELLVELENRTGIAMDEATFTRAQTLSDVARIIPSEAPARIAAEESPGWQTFFLVRWFGAMVLYGLVFPAMHRRIKVKARGLENLDGLNPPVLFVANHQSIIDVPVILKALPPRYRIRLAPAMGTRSQWELFAAKLFFNAYHLPNDPIGLRTAMLKTGRLADGGFCPLVFPEGTRTPTGDLLPFRSGIGFITHHLQLPVVPVLIQGAYDIWPIQARGPRSGKPPVTVTFGQPIDFTGKEPAEITKQLEDWFHSHV